MHFRRGEERYEQLVRNEVLNVLRKITLPVEAKLYAHGFDGVNPRAIASDVLVEFFSVLDLPPKSRRRQILVGTYLE